MYVIDNTFTVTFTNATAAEKAKAIAISPSACMNQGLPRLPRS